MLTSGRVLHMGAGGGIAGVNVGYESREFPLLFFGGVMMKTLMTLLLACGMMATVSNTAMAGGDGGGGAKDDGTIVVRNDAGADQILLVIVGEFDGKLTTFTARGGQIVQPGDTATFNVAAGSQRITGLFVHDVSLAVVGTPTTVTKNVVKQQTVNVSATIFDGGAELD